MILLNGNKVEISRFPNGEMKIGKINEFVDLWNFNKVVLKYEDDSDLIALMMVKKHLDTTGTITSLTINYMPYSRMDRSKDGSIFTLKYIADFINWLNFAYILVIEPHSDVTPAVLNNCISIDASLQLLSLVEKEVEFNKETDYLFFPDAGAQKRYEISGYKSLVGNKKRDWDTGRIKSLDIIGEVDNPRKVIIVDDLCSYGGTFNMSALELKKLMFDEIYLVVTHCEESIFAGDIFHQVKGLINKVFTTDSILNKEMVEEVYRSEIEKLKIYNLEEVVSI